MGYFIDYITANTRDACKWLALSNLIVQTFDLLLKKWFPRRVVDLRSVERLLHSYGIYICRDLSTNGTY